MNHSIKSLLRQGLRFLCVGGVFTLLDIVLHYILVMMLRVGSVPLPTYLGEALGVSESARAHSLGVTVLKACTATFATANSFYWNRRWTFEATGDPDRIGQALKFFAVAGSGMVVNTAIAGALYGTLPGSDQKRWLISTGIATTAVTAWNFWGHRLWTFRERRLAESSSA